MISSQRRTGIRNWTSVVLILSLFGVEVFRYPLPLYMLTLKAASRSSIQIDTDRYPKILIIAPHPDDEVLSSGGLIQAASSAQSDIRFVIMTNGDGQVFGPLITDRKFAMNSQDYLAFGEHRKQEALSAGALLGISSNQYVFLGLPDGNLNDILSNINEDNCPVASDTTSAVCNPYEDPYEYDGSYCGVPIVNNLYKIIREFIPDLIVLPVPFDEHPDHRSTSALTWLALSLIHRNLPGYDPALFGYLIHYKGFPDPNIVDAELSLQPPVDRQNDRGRWMYLSINEQGWLQKKAAIQAYETQVLLLSDFLFEFVRKNELYLQLSIKTLSPFYEYSSLRINPSSYTALYNQQDPLKRLEEELIQYIDP